MCIWRELVLDAADDEEERLKVLELGGRQLEKAGGSISRNGGVQRSVAQSPRLRIREGDVLVESRPGGLLVLLERVCRRLESATELALRSIRGRSRTSGDENERGARIDDAGRGVQDRFTGAVIDSLIDAPILACGGGASDRHIIHVTSDPILPHQFHASSNGQNHNLLGRVNTTECELAIESTGGRGRLVEYTDRLGRNSALLGEIVCDSRHRCGSSNGALSKVNWADAACVRMSVG